MFAQHSVTVPYRSDAVAALVAAPDHPWSFGLDGDGANLLAKVGIHVGRIPLYKHVRITLGSPPSTQPADSMMLPVSWESVGGPPLFPSMEGILHVNPEGPFSTRLTLNARYDPPLGTVGHLLDRALMHHLAQASIEDFMVRFCDRVAEELSRPASV